MEWLEQLLDGKSPASEEFAKEAVEAHLFGRREARRRLPFLYRQAATAEMPAWEEFEPVVAKFFDLLREKLRLSNDHYREIFDSLAAERMAAAAAKMAGTVAESERGPALRTIPTAPELSEEEAETARERYCRQLAERARHSGDGFSFLDFLYCNAEEILNVDPPLPEGFFEHFLRRGECLVLFDGLDEVTELSERIAVRDAVRSFANAFPDNRYLITSRPAGYEEAPLRDGYTHFQILDFTDDEIEEFVTKWYELRELSEREAKDKRESLLTAIKRSPGVKRLAVNPLLLTIIALIHRQEAELPNQRVILYDKCTEVLLYSWERAKGLEWDIGPEEMRRRLEHIAFWMYERGEVSAERAVAVEREELEWELARFLRGRLPDPTRAADEARRFLDLVQERAGLLMETGRGLYSFAHLTFQEYFAAMDVIYRFYDELDLEVVREVVLGHLHEPAWREVSLLAMSKLKPKQATRLLREVLEARSDYEDVLHRDLFFAARCLADDVEVDWELADEILGRLVEIFRTTDLWPLQSDALEALIALRGSRYASPAAELLLPLASEEEVEPWVRRFVASSLGELGRVDEAIPILLELARDEEVRPWVRRSAASSLGELGRVDEAVPILLQLARDEKVEPEVRSFVASSLGELGRVDEAIPILLELARDEKIEPLVRSSAASSLGELGRVDEAVPILLQLARDEELEPWVRSFVASFLGGLGRVDEAISILLQLARDEKVEPGVRSSAASSLGELGRVDEAINALLELARDEELEPLVRSEAASSLGELGRVDEAIPILLELARDEKVEPEVRSEAYGALKELVGKARGQSTAVNG